jgi:hypothetical protein
MLPFGEAPELMGEVDDARGYSHCYVKRQPKNFAETEQMLSAIQVAELRCIRYRGTDSRIQSRLVEDGEGEICDHLSPELELRARTVDAQLARKRQAETTPRWKRLLKRIFFPKDAT